MYPVRRRVQPLAQRNPVKRPKGLSRRKTGNRRQKPHIWRQVIQDRLPRPFVEIAGPDGWHPAEIRITVPDMGDLPATRGREQPKMHAHHTKRTNRCLELDPNCPARLQTRQIVMPRLTDRDMIAFPDNGIAMPAQTARTAQIDDLPTGLVQHEMRQCCWSGRQAFVGLLQHDDIGLHPFDDLQNTLRLSAKIQTNAFLNVIAGKAQGLCHETAMFGILRPLVTWLCSKLRNHQIDWLAPFSG